MLGKVIQFLGLLLFVAFVIGFVLLATDNIYAKKVIGFSVLVLVFVLMPLFLYHRWNGKRLRDYTLSKENMDRMREVAKKHKF